MISAKVDGRCDVDGGFLAKLAYRESHENTNDGDLHLLNF